VMPAPPMPFVPAEVHGSLVILALMAYAGETEPGQQALAPFRALATPIADFLRPMTYAEMFPSEEGGPKVFGTNRTLFMDHVDEAAAELILERIEEHVRTTNALAAAVQIRVLGGSMARVPADATAFAHRGSPIMIAVAAVVGSLDDLPAHQSWLEEFAAALNQGDDGKYVNFIVDEDEAAVRKAYPGATWDRLAAIKARYDPTNLFHLNQNIAPAAD
jgi:FAD/FMN-containing dehydrogenase